MTLLGWLSDPFKGLSDLQLGDEKVTLNHHFTTYNYIVKKIQYICFGIYVIYENRTISRNIDKKLGTYMYVNINIYVFICKHRSWVVTNYRLHFTMIFARHCSHLCHFLIHELNCFVLRDRFHATNQANRHIC